MRIRWLSREHMPRLSRHGVPRAAALAGFGIIVLAILLGLLLTAAAPVLSAGASADTLSRAPIDHDFAVSTDAERTSVLGLRLGPQDLSHTVGMRVPGAAPLAALPSSYDLRTLGRVTSVKDQGPFGTCWAFASLGSLESCLLPGESNDFSEDHLALTSGYDERGGLYNAGGNIKIATAYLARWGGPVFESEDAYGDSVTSPGLSPRKHVLGADWIPARASSTDNGAIKTAVMQLGAVTAPMYFDLSSQGGGDHYRVATQGYYYDGAASINHEVLIVGWNDDFPAGSFATTAPGNGAFLIRNSWGTSWGNGGYFWISYYDTQFARSTSEPLAVIDVAEGTDEYSDVYEYDPLGYIESVGYLSTTAWFANVFTARAAESLSAVGFYSLSPGSTYEVYTGTSLDAKTLNAGGTFTYMGYHTVSLTAPLALAKGQTFVVAVKITSPGADYPIAAEEPLSNYSSGATAEAGQSFVSSDGADWQDLTTTFDDTNVCLKAYVEPLPAPTTIKVDLQSGWNLVAGGPGSDTGGRVVFAYAPGGYESLAAAAMQSGRGYWVKSSAAATAAMTSTTLPIAVSLVAGWNLIGNSSDQLVSLPVGATAFAYEDGNYLSTRTLAPGQGAWLRSVSAGAVTLTDAPDVGF